MPRELKPEDVMRALECCTMALHSLCPYRDNWCCDHDLVTNALALLREKDAEIERLKNEIEQEKRNCRMTQHLLKNAYESIEKKDKRTETIRAEAITEFAERLYPLYKVLCVDEGDWRNEVDKIAKKMKEG